jgi:hypothetical protein
MAKIGDLIPKSGMYTNPGVVTEKHEDGTVTIDTEPLTVSKFHRYSNTTGLSEEEKMSFNNVLDTIYSKENPVDRLNDIQVTIDDLKKDPRNKNVVQYLRNQQAVMIRETRQLPRHYAQDEAMLNGVRNK